MKIAIAGCGWLGEALAEKLSLKGNIVTGTKRSQASDGKSFSIVKYDPSETVSREVKAAFEDADWLVLSFPPDRSNYEAYAKNCLTTVSIAGKQTKILMISSTGIYSDKLEVASEEDADYSIPNAVLLAEKELLGLYGNRLTIIRMAGLFGDDRLIVNRMSESGKIYNGNEPVNLIHKEDAAGICEFVIEKDIIAEIINGCTPDHPLKKDFYPALAAKLGIPSPIFKDGARGKIISPAKSVKLGYNYKFKTLDQSC